MKSIIYIDRNNLYFYGGNVHAPLTFPFKPTTVRDIEVINDEELEKELNEFIKNNKIEPSDAMLIIAHQSSFEKNIDIKIPPDQVELQKKQFIENVPFEQTLSKTFIDKKGTKVIVANKDLAYLIRDIFNKNHFIVEIIASVAALFPDGDITFNAAAAQQMLNKSSVFKQNMFLLKDVEIPSTDAFEETYGKEKKVNKLFYLIPVFLVLIGILVWLIIGQRTPKKNKIAINPSPALVSARVSPTLTLAPTNIASTAATLLPKETITIEILNGSGIVGQADTIREQLEDANYEAITTGNAPTRQTTRTLILFKSRIPIPQREEIVSIVSDVAGEATTQINEEIESDILITTASSSEQNTITPTP